MTWTREVTESYDRPPHQHIKITTRLYKHPQANLRVEAFQSNGEQKPYAVQFHLTETSPYILYFQFLSEHLHPFERSDHSTFFTAHFRVETAEGKRIRTRILELFIDHFKLFNTEMHKELYALFEIQPTNEMVLDDLMKLIDQLKYSEAIQSALNLQAQDRFNPIWLLAEQLYKRAQDKKYDYQSLYELYDQISKLNPYYASSQERKLEILNQQKREKDNAIFLLEQQFITAINLGDSNITLSSRLFNELCGDPFLNQPTIEDVKIDIPSFLQLAAHKRAMNARIKELKQYCTELENKCAKLEMNNAALEAKCSALEVNKDTADKHAELQSEAEAANETLLTTSPRYASVTQQRQKASYAEVLRQGNLTFVPVVFTQTSNPSFGRENSKKQERPQKG